MMSIGPERLVNLLSITKLKQRFKSVIPKNYSILDGNFKGSISLSSKTIAFQGHK